MGNGNVDVGNETPTRKPGQAAVEDLSGRNGSSELRIERSPGTERHCGAMSQQGGEFRGNVSEPQKFVRLVGCREVRQGSEVRQYPNPAKR